MRCCTLQGMVMNRVPADGYVFIYIREDKSIGDESIEHKSVELSDSPFSTPFSTQGNHIQPRPSSFEREKCHLILISNRQDTEAFVASRKCNKLDLNTPLKKKANVRGTFPNFMYKQSYIPTFCIRKGKAPPQGVLIPETSGPTDV